MDERRWGVGGSVGCGHCCGVVMMKREGASEEADVISELGVGC